MQKLFCKLQSFSSSDTLDRWPFLAVRFGGFSFLYRIATLIEIYSDKAIDLLIKFVCCKSCEINKSELNAMEYGDLLTGIM